MKSLGEMHMLEIPEVIVLANQLNETVKGKKIQNAIANSSAHKFTWYYGDPESYPQKLIGKTIGESSAFGGRLDIKAKDVLLNFGDGVNLRYHETHDTIPKKHQLLIAFEDGSFLSATVAMYGGILCCRPDEIKDDTYYKAAKDSVSPLSDQFDTAYYNALFSDKTLKLSAKAFLATEQRIPGLGNGVLQDILLNAKIHPKKKMNTFTETQLIDLFGSIKNTLSEMLAKGGRDTEKDLFGNSGGYRTKLSKNTALSLCPNCGGTIIKENYLGGSIYYCDRCQEK